jgi:hypothetical protein
MEIPSRRFFGECVRSPNQRYTLAWRDASDSGTVGGFRRSGKGRYLLLDGKQVISEGSIARPNDGKVADNGTFIFNDWGLGDGLQGTFFACDKVGRKLVTRRFKANLFNNGLSPSGDVAVCQTCNSYESEDGSILTLFDLRNGVELAHWIPESGWADFYALARPGIIQLGYARMGTFAYSWSGEFLDRERWQEAKLAHGDYSGTMMMIEHLLKAEVASQNVDGLLRSLDRIEPTIPTSDLKNQARAKRLRGQCLEGQDNLPEALRCYEEAISLDPKVGLKRRVVQLTKLLATDI